MSAAIFGLIGVLIGGLITAGTQWIRERFVRRRERTIATRLVASEFMNARAAINFPEVHSQWWPNELQWRDWEKYAPILTAELNMQEWLVVLEAHDAIAVCLRTQLDSEEPLAPVREDDLKYTVAQIEKAVAWLSTHSFNFRWWQIRKRFGVWVARQNLHRDGPDVPS